VSEKAVSAFQNPAGGFFRACRLFWTLPAFQKAVSISINLSDTTPTAIFARAQI